MSTNPNLRLAALLPVASLLKKSDESDHQLNVSEFQLCYGHQDSLILSPQPLKRRTTIASPLGEDSKLIALDGQVKDNTLPVKGHPADTGLPKQVADIQPKFKLLAKLKIAGMYDSLQNGKMVHENDSWYQLTGHPRYFERPTYIEEAVRLEKDEPITTEEWRILSTKIGKKLFPIRLRNPFFELIASKGKEKWVFLSCDQGLESTGVSEIFTEPITNIAPEKQINDSEAGTEEQCNVTERVREPTEEIGPTSELIPSGWFIFDPEGKITWLNCQWYDKACGPKPIEGHYSMSFLDAIDENDHSAFRLKWRELNTAKQEFRLELRVKKPWLTDMQAENSMAWILFLAFPQLDEKENLTKVFCFTTDICYFTLVENIQVQVKETQLGQERLEDVTSHINHVGNAYEIVPSETFHRNGHQMTSLPSKILQVERSSQVHEESSKATSEISLPTTSPPINLIEPAPAKPIPRKQYGYHILAIEDNLVNARVMTKLMFKFGCTVHVTNNAEEALEFLRKTDLWKGNISAKDVVVLNAVVINTTTMSSEDDLACIRRIRRWEEKGLLRGHVPIVVTLRSLPQNREVAIDAGADDVLLGLLRPVKMVDMIDGLIRKWLAENIRAWARSKL